MSRVTLCDGEHAYPEGETAFEVRALVHVDQTNDPAGSDLCREHLLAFFAQLALPPTLAITVRPVP